MRPTSWVMALLLACLFASHARARSFELIYPDTMDVTLCHNQCGITLGGASIGLLVNHGTEPITVDDLQSVQFATTSSDPGFLLSVFFDLGSSPDIAPILPGEVIGGVLTPFDLWTNSIFSQEIRPGETLRNTSAQTFLVGSFDRLGSNTDSGWVAETVLMVMGDRAVRFVVHVNLHAEGPRGGLGLDFIHAARVISVPLTDPVQATTWGSLRLLYR